MVICGPPCPLWWRGNIDIVWVDLADLDFSEGSPQLKLDLTGELAVQGGIAGNVADKFADKGPMTFLSLKMMEALEGGEKNSA